MPKRPPAFVLLTLAFMAHGQQLPLVSYDNFSDGFGSWKGFGTASYTTVPEPPIGTYADYYVWSTHSALSGIGREYGSSTGWMLFRFDLDGQPLCGEWLQPYSNRACPTHIYYSGPAETPALSLSIFGNFYRGDYGRWPMVCSVHRYSGPQGDIVIGDPPSVGFRSNRLTNLAAYHIPDSLALSPGLYKDRAEIVRAVHSNPEGIDTVRHRYQITYGEIAVRAPTLVVHLRPSQNVQMPLAVLVNDSFVAEVATTPGRPCSDCTELSFGWLPGTDTISVTFLGVRDSVAYATAELSIFFVDLDTTTNPTVGMARKGFRATTGAPNSGSDVVVDIRGRAVRLSEVTLGTGIRVRRTANAVSSATVEIAP